MNKMVFGFIKFNLQFNDYFIMKFLVYCLCELNLYTGHVEINNKYCMNFLCYMNYDVHVI